MVTLAVRRLAIVVVLIGVLLGLFACSSTSIGGPTPVDGEARSGEMTGVPSSEKPFLSSADVRMTRIPYPHNATGVPSSSAASASRASASLTSLSRAEKAGRPTVSDSRLGRALGDDYRGGPNPIGDGSALDAARHTVKTGDLVGGSTHLEKIVEMRDRYGRILRGGLSGADQDVARSRFNAYRDFARDHDLDAMMRARGLR